MTTFILLSRNNNNILRMFYKRTTQQQQQRLHNQAAASITSKIDINEQQRSSFRLTSSLLLTTVGVCFATVATTTALMLLTTQNPAEDENNLKENDEKDSLNLWWYSPTITKIAQCEEADVQKGQQEQAVVATSSSTSLKTQFQLLNALEIREEMHKLRLARFLRYLNDLAKERTNITLQKRITEYSIIRKHETSKDDSTHISFERGMNLLQDLTPQLTQHYITRLRNGESMSRSAVIQLAKAATTVLKQDESLVDLRNNNDDKIIVIGDLHGSLKCLSKILDKIGNNNMDKSTIVVTGDFVDRGKNSIEVLCTLLLLKITYPTKVILLRGNHEDTMISSVYGFLDEIRNKYGGKNLKQKHSEYNYQPVWDELANVFSALPLCARTETALLMHGGIPYANFNLNDVAKITSEQRSQLHTIVEPRTEIERIIEGILWSDPMPDNGIEPNPRGCGIEFGPDIANEFLRRHNLKCIIRSHEPVEEGADALLVGDGKAVVTVFSAANYPNGEGTNNGAFISLENGICHPIHFAHNDDDDLLEQDQRHVACSVAEQQQSAIFQNDKAQKSCNNPIEDAIRSFITDNRGELMKAFQSVDIDDNGFITPLEWATIMATKMNICNDNIIESLLAIAPTSTTSTNSTDLVDWKNYLDMLHVPTLDRIVDKGQADLIRANQERLLKIFKFLDTDGNGGLDLQEFVIGINILNDKHLPKDKQIQDPIRLFHILDTDGNGEIDIEEFSNVIYHSQALSGITDSLNQKQIENLRENHAMLLTVFKFLDTDQSGTIDRTEFQIGVDLVNKRLSDDGGTKLFTNPQELFNLLDLDGNGEIDMEEFRQIFHAL